MSASPHCSIHACSKSSICRVRDPGPLRDPACDGCYRQGCCKILQPPVPRFVASITNLSSSTWLVVALEPDATLFTYAQGSRQHCVEFPCSFYRVMEVQRARQMESNEPAASRSKRVTYTQNPTSDCQICTDMWVSARTRFRTTLSTSLTTVDAYAGQTIRTNPYHVVFLQATLAVSELPLHLNQRVHPRSSDQWPCCKMLLAQNTATLLVST
jgi:hypothetical protein